MVRDFRHFSKEHHEGILFAWKIKREIMNNTDIDTVRNYISCFWNNLLIHHFREEKEMLVRYLDTDSIIKSKIEAEHNSIMDMAYQIMKKRSHEKDIFVKLAEKIRQQIYFEEAVFFPYIRGKK